MSIDMRGSATEDHLLAVDHVYAVGKVLKRALVAVLHEKISIEIVNCEFSCIAEDRLYTVLNIHDVLLNIDVLVESKNLAIVIIILDSSGRNMESVLTAVELTESYSHTR